MIIILKEKLSEFAISETILKLETVSTQIEYDELFQQLSKVLFTIKNSNDLLKDLKEGSFDFINLNDYKIEISEIISECFNKLFKYL